MQYDIQKPRTNLPDRRLRFLYEVLFSLNTGLALTAITFRVAGWFLLSPVVKMEMYLNNLFHIRQWDFIRGYFAFYIPSIAVSSCLWILLRLTSSTKLTKGFLYWAAGPLILLGMPTYWFYLAARYNLWGWYGSHTWRLGLSPFEPAVALLIALVYVLGKWPAPWWGAVPLLVLHFFFWASPTQAVSFGPLVLAAPTVGFSASVIWMLYTNRLRNTAAEGTTLHQT